MLSLEECRSILDEDSKDYSDEELKLIRDWLYHIAEIAIDASQKTN
jgi:hypothetical protein